MRCMPASASERSLVSRAAVVLCCARALLPAMLLLLLVLVMLLRKPAVSCAWQCYQVGGALLCLFVDCPHTQLHPTEKGAAVPLAGSCGGG